jgi:hypothetical protein
MLSKNTINNNLKRLIIADIVVFVIQILLTLIWLIFSGFNFEFISKLILNLIVTTYGDNQLLSMNIVLPAMIYHIYLLTINKFGNSYPKKLLNALYFFAHLAFIYVVSWVLFIYTIYIISGKMLVI